MTQKRYVYLPKAAKAAKAAMMAAAALLTGILLTPQAWAQG
jgi:hypothetical protein